MKNIKIPLDECILVPVPLHAIKKRERGYNQSELIAKGISEITKIPVVTNLVKRIKNTATQTKMNKKERIENMHRAFVAQSEIVAKTVIIVDDVYTTGTTINSVAEAMKNKKGNLKIIAYTAAMPES
ncbi:MAG: ComF family protein [Candidatus Marinimicrobia bacterium]|nr:ComF family protein [Candidatus Neomarinimicrobiota bacterium]